MKFRAALMAVICALSVAACTGSTESLATAESDIANLTGEDATVKAAPSKPAPRYDEREGDTYFYIGDVSEEERKQGKALGSIVGFRSLGMTDDAHRLAAVSDSGSVIRRYECPAECKIIKSRDSTGVERLPYDQNSIIGAAFADAIGGNLQVAKSADVKAKAEASTPSATDIIPAAFRGEWNEDAVACGSALNDSRLKIEVGRIRFYESSGDVAKVETPNQRTLKVTASMAGEGETWTSTHTFVLSGSGLRG